MVEVEYKPRTEQSSLPYLKPFLGIYMGRMQTWLWEEQHPGFMDGLMLIASLPIQAAPHALWYLSDPQQSRSGPA
jgi:homoserine O-acetyltransferase/O-succinyltransferase